MFAHPVKESLLINVALGVAQSENHRLHFVIRLVKLVSVQVKKGEHGDCRRALVAINECLAFGDEEAVRGGFYWNGGVEVILSERLAWGKHGRGQAIVRTKAWYSST